MPNKKLAEKWNKLYNTKEIENNLESVREGKLSLKSFATDYYGISLSQASRMLRKYFSKEELEGTKYSVKPDQVDQKVDQSTNKGLTKNSQPKQSTMQVDQFKDLKQKVEEQEYEILELKKQMQTINRVNLSRATGVDIAKDVEGLLESLTSLEHRVKELEREKDKDWD